MLQVRLQVWNILVADHVEYVSLQLAADATSPRFHGEFLRTTLNGFHVWKLWSKLKTSFSTNHMMGYVHVVPGLERKQMEYWVFSSVHIFLSSMWSGPLLLGKTHCFDITSYMDAVSVFRVNQLFPFRVFCQGIGRPNTTKWWHHLLIRLLG
jgi:hypothetical protein